jgi:hypothetical protein
MRTERLRNPSVNERNLYIHYTTPTLTKPTRLTIETRELVTDLDKLEVEREGVIAGDSITDAERR